MHLFNLFICLSICIFFICITYIYNIIIYNMDYRKKYSKYKRKYINLKNRMYGEYVEDDIINDIIEIIKHLEGYVKIFDEEFHAKIFRESHTHWIKLLKRIIYEQTCNRIDLLVKLRTTLQAMPGRHTRFAHLLTK